MNNMRTKKDILAEIKQCREAVVVYSKELNGIEALVEEQRTPEMVARHTGLAQEISRLSNRVVELNNEVVRLVEAEEHIQKSIKIKEIGNNNNDSDMEEKRDSNKKRRRGEINKDKKADPDQTDGSDTANSISLVSFLIVLLPVADNAGGIKGLLDLMTGVGIAMPLEAFFKCRDTAWDHKGYVVKFAEKDIPLFRTIITQIQTNFGFIPRAQDMFKFVGNCYTLKISEQFDRSALSPTNVQEFVENKYDIRIVCVSHSRPYGKNHQVNFFVHLEFMEDARRLHNLPAVQIHNNIYATMAMQWKSVFNSGHGENTCVLIGRNINYNLPDSQIDTHLKEAMRVQGYERDFSFFWIKPRDLKERIINHKIWVHAPSEEHAEAITSTEWESNGIVVHWDRATNREEVL